MVIIWGLSLSQTSLLGQCLLRDHCSSPRSRTRNVDIRPICECRLFCLHLQVFSGTARRATRSQPHARRSALQNLLKVRRRTSLDHSHRYGLRLPCSDPRKFLPVSHRSSSSALRLSHSGPCTRVDTERPISSIRRKSSTMLKPIPSELIGLVLGQLRNDKDKAAGKAFTNALLVCSQWRDIGLELLWKDVVLESRERMSKFVQLRSIHPMSNIFDSGLIISPYIRRIKSLTVSYSPEQFPTGGHYEKRDVRDFLDNFSTMLRSMKMLNVFSFHTRKPSKQYYDEFNIYHSALEPLVSNLPRSLRHLELDTKGCDVSDYSFKGGHNLCSAIGEKMPQLNSLRLRLSHICPSFIRPSNTLRSIVIALISRSTRWMVEYCCTLDEFPTTYPEVVRRCIVKALQAQMSYMPLLQTCDVVDHQFLGEDGDYLSGSIINNRDLLRDLTTSYRSVSIDRPSCSCQLDSSIFWAYKEIIKQEICGIYHLGPDAENHAWRSTTTDLRLPSLVTDTLEGRRHQLEEKKRYRVEEMSVYSPCDYKHQVSGWRAGNVVQTGSSSVRVIKGVGDIEPYRLGQ